jgi:hypothetical protein
LHVHSPSRRVGEIVGVRHRVVERLTEYLDALRRHTRRSRKGPREQVRRHREFDCLPIRRGLGVVQRQRHIEVVLVLLQSELHKHVDLLVLHPLRTRHFQRDESHRAESLRLAALHGQQGFGRAGIAGDDLELRLQDVVEQSREQHGVAGGAGAADDQFALQQIVEGFH